jgi:predicted PurR-regulated permease PerM
MALTGLFVIAWFSVLYVARSVFIPLTFAVLLSFVLSPVVTAIARRRLGRTVAGTLVVLGLVSAATFVTVEVAGPAADWAGRLPAALKDVERKVRPLRAPMANVENIVERVDRIARVDPSAQKTIVAEKSTLELALGRVWNFALGTIAVVIALHFVLISGDSLLERLIRLVPDLKDQRRTSHVLEQIHQRMSQYLLTISVINAALGVAVTLALMLCRLPNPVLWGLMAALVNYVPYLGSLLGVLTVGLASLLTFEQPLQILAPPLAYLALTMVEGNVITPLVLGRTFRVHPVVVFAWLLFWAWLWGVAGALMAVPLLMLLKITCEQSRVLAPIAELISR